MMQYHKRWHVFASALRVPLGQEHEKEPGELVHTCSHPPFDEAHSLISERDYEYIAAIMCTPLTIADNVRDDRLPDTAGVAEVDHI